jgi:hypothetical protein
MVLDVQKRSISTWSVAFTTPHFNDFQGRREIDVAWYILETSMLQKLEKLRGPDVQRASWFHAALWTSRMSDRAEHQNWCWNERGLIFPIPSLDEQTFIIKLSYLNFSMQQPPIVLQNPHLIIFLVVRFIHHSMKPIWWLQFQLSNALWIMSNQTSLVKSNRLILTYHQAWSSGGWWL